MPVAPVLILFIAIVAANLAVMALILVPPLVGRTSPLASDTTPGVDAERRAAEEAIVGGIEGSVTDDGVSTRTYDRVVRVVSWVFLLTTTAIVAATGLWPETQLAIFVLLAFSGLFVVIVHDLLPPDTLGPAKFVVEGSVAITVATLLVALTGGDTSPFFFAFPLIVGGAALVVSPAITVETTWPGCVCGGVCAPGAKSSRVWATSYGPAGMIAAVRWRYCVISPGAAGGVAPGSGVEGAAPCGITMLPIWSARTAPRLRATAATPGSSVSTSPTL